jgi:hypothetical protein
MLIEKIEIAMRMERQMDFEGPNQLSSLIRRKIGKPEFNSITVIRN